MPSSPQTWKAIGNSVAGASHHKNRTPCQDSLRWRVLENGILIAALADGAGSARLAEVGSATAAEAALEKLSALFAKPVSSDAEISDGLKGALESARAAVVAESEKRAALPRDLATTLIVAVISPQFAAAAQIGDGAVLAGETVETLASITSPVASEYLNETQFLTSDNAVETAQVVVKTIAVRQVALFSDGLQMLCLKMSDAAPHVPFFKPLFNFLQSSSDMRNATEQLTTFLASPRITDRTDDDLTLFLATR